MGAPGLAFFCRRGHLYHWIEEHLHDVDTTIEEAISTRKRNCDCGEPFLLQVCHYGDLNDCVCLPDRIDEEGIKPTGVVTKILKKIEGAVTLQGEALEAYGWKHLPIYDLSKVDQG